MTLGCPQRPALHLPGQLRRGPGVEARERSLFLRPAAWVTSPFVPLSHSEKPLPRCHVISSVAMRNSVFSRKRCSLAREGRELGAAPLLPAPRPLQGSRSAQHDGTPARNTRGPSPLTVAQTNPHGGMGPGRPGEARHAPRSAPGMRHPGSAPGLFLHPWPLHVGGECS